MMKRNTVGLLLCILSIVCFGCDLDGHIDTDNLGQSQPDVVNVTVSQLVDGLNYPTSVRIIDSDDPQGTGESSVLQKGNILVANAGTTGSYAQSILEVDPLASSISVFSNSTLTDSAGEPGVNRPAAIAFPGAYPWVANATYCTGAVSVLDAAPGVGYDGPRSQAGEPISGPFNTGVFGCGDFHLTITSVYPPNGAMNVSLNSRISVTFSRPVNPATVTYESFTVELEDADAPTGMTVVKGIVPGTYTFSADLKTVTFYPSQPLVSSTDYELSVYSITCTDDIMDVFGRSLDANLYTPDDEDEFQAIFSTEIERLPPRIVAVHPAYYQQVGQDTAVILTFSEPVRTDSVDEHSFKLVKGDYDGYWQEPEITGDKYWYDENRVLAFIPDDSDFAESSIYYILATGTLPSGYPGIQDRAGNALDGDGDGSPGGDFWSSFFTKGFDDAPYIISIIPQRGSTNVDVNTTVDVIFSEPVYSGSITNRSFLLFWGDGQIPGIVTKSEGYIEATFTPYEPLPYNARIDVILTAEIEDVEGNPLDGNRDGIGGDNYYGWFSTGDDPTNIPPTVQSITPNDNQGDVDINTVVTVSFSKDVDATTVNTSSFYLSQGASVYPGSVTMISTNSATFTPIAPLAYDTVYTVTLTDSITDLDGRRLDGDGNGTPGGTFQSTFTTSVDPASVPVYVQAISPTNGQTGVSVTTSIVVTFSRAINPSTVWTGNFYMYNGGDTVLGTVTVAPDNRHATLTPDDPISDGTLYHVQLLDTILDPGGIALDGDHDGVAGGWFYSEFTTGSALSLVINEFLPAPATDWDGDSTFSATDDEWIELYNGGATSVDLTGLYLADATALRYQFGAESLPAGGHIVIYGSEQGSLSLNNSGDTVYLYDSDGSTVIDSHSYGSVSSDASIQRVPDGSATWEESSSCAAPGGGSGCPTPGTTNSGALKGMFSLFENSAGAAAQPYNQLLSGNWGFGGITYGGPSPDSGNSDNVQFFASKPLENDIYVFDYNSGYYNIGGALPELIENPTSLVFVPDWDQNGNALVSSGLLFITLPDWDSIAAVRLMPTGPVGAPNIYTTVDMTNPISFYPMEKDPQNPVLMNPVDVIYCEENGLLYVANRGNASVAAFDTTGKFLTIYKTNLGMEMISSIDVGDWGQGLTVVLATTGGLYTREDSGPQGALFTFKP